MGQRGEGRQAMSIMLSYMSWLASTASFWNGLPAVLMQARTPSVKVECYRVLVFVRA